MAERKFGDGCSGCYYRRKAKTNGIISTCDFCYETGVSRGCEAGEGCTRYKKNTKKKNAFEEFADE